MKRASSRRPTQDILEWCGNEVAELLMRAADLERQCQQQARLIAGLRAQRVERERELGTTKKTLDAYRSMLPFKTELPPQRTDNPPAPTHSNSTGRNRQVTADHRPVRNTPQRQP